MRLLSAPQQWALKVHSWINERGCWDISWREPEKALSDRGGLWENEEGKNGETKKKKGFLWAITARLSSARFGKAGFGAAFESQYQHQDGIFGFMFYTKVNILGRWRYIYTHLYCILSWAEVDVLFFVTKMTMRILTHRSNIMTLNTPHLFTGSIFSFHYMSYMFFFCFLAVSIIHNIWRLCIVDAVPGMEDIKISWYTIYFRKWLGWKSAVSLKQQ